MIRIKDWRGRKKYVRKFRATLTRNGLYFNTALTNALYDENFNYAEILVSVVKDSYIIILILHRTKDEDRRGDLFRIKYEPLKGRKYCSRTYSRELIDLICVSDKLTSEKVIYDGRIVWIKL